MTGWRIGYAGGPKPLIGAMKKIQSQSTSNPTSISQAASVAALSGDQSCVAQMRDAFEERHAYVLERLNAMPGVECLPADGTFYSFPRVQAAIDRLEGIADDTQFAQHLLETVGVALVPGAAFGAPGHLRLSFATSRENLEKALDRMEQALAG
jgi:aspartate aminotransferase